MELYKFISETEIQKYKEGFVIYKNRIYTNPTESYIRKAGFKNLIHSAIPEYDENTQYIEKTYVDGDNITEVYNVKNIEVIK